MCQRTPNYFPILLYHPSIQNRAFPSTHISERKLPTPIIKCTYVEIIIMKDLHVILKFMHYITQVLRVKHPVMYIETSSQKITHKQMRTTKST